MKLYLSVLSLVLVQEQLFGVEQLSTIALGIELPYVTVTLISLDGTSIRAVVTVD
jgi:hypothetical protein